VEVVLTGNTGKMVMGRKVALVTGATGFIGRHLVDRLRQGGGVARVYTRRLVGHAESLFPDCECFSGELNDSSSLDTACEGADVVFHLAGLAHSISRSEEEVRRANVDGTRSVLESALRNGVRRFVYISSTHAGNPTVSLYARSKLEAEEEIRAVLELDPGIEVVILRPANVYGVGMRGGLRKFLELSSRGWLPSLPELQSQFSLVSVTDLCEVAIHASESVFKRHEKIILNTVTDGELYTVSRIEDAVYQSLGRRPPRMRAPRWALLAGAAVAQFLNKFRDSPNTLGMGLYKNLVRHQGQRRVDTPANYPFTPTTTLESELPSILESLR